MWSNSTGNTSSLPLLICMELIKCTSFRRIACARLVFLALSGLLLLAIGRLRRGPLRPILNLLRLDLANDPLEAFQYLVSEAVYLGRVLIDVEPCVVSILEGASQFRAQLCHELAHLFGVMLRWRSKRSRTAVLAGSVVVEEPPGLQGIVGAVHVRPRWSGTYTRSLLQGQQRGRWEVEQGLVVEVAPQG